MWKRCWVRTERRCARVVRFTVPEGVTSAVGLELLLEPPPAAPGVPCGAARGRLARVCPRCQVGGRARCVLCGLHLCSLRSAWAAVPPTENRLEGSAD